MGQRMTPARALTEAGLTVGIGVVLSLLGVYVPIFSIVTWFLWPIPLAFLGTRHGIRWSTMAGAAIIIILLFLTGPLIATRVGLLFGPMGILLGEGFRQRWSAGYLLTAATTVFMLGFFLHFAILFYIMDVNILELYREALTQSTQMVFETFEGSGYNSIELDQMKTEYLKQQEQTRQLVPFLLLSGGMIIAYVDIVMASYVLRRLQVPTVDFPPAAEWELPRAALYIYVAALVVELVGSDWAYWVPSVAMNIKVCCMFLILIQGIAVIFWLARRYKVVRFFRWVIVILGIFIPLFTTFLFLAGLIDMGLNYRKRKHYR